MSKTVIEMRPADNKKSMGHGKLASVTMKDSVAFSTKSYMKNAKVNFVNIIFAFFI